MTSQRVKNKKVRHEVEWRDCCSLHAVTSSVINYSTHTRKNVSYLFYTIKIQMVYWRILGTWKKKNKSADVILRGPYCICKSKFNSASHAFSSFNCYSITSKIKVPIIVYCVFHWPTEYHWNNRIFQTNLLLYLRKLSSCVLSVQIVVTVNSFH